MNLPGIRLLHSAREASKSACIVSPFIKYSALQRVLSSLNSSVSVTVVTRWRLDELAIGVSDLSVFDACNARSDCRLLLCDALHAKYFRFDETTLIGSANLTGAGMGWSLTPNIEILEIASAAIMRSDFEARLLEASITVSSELREQFADALGRLPPFANPPPPDALEIVDVARPHSPWIPASRDPAAIRSVYFGDTTDLFPLIASQATQDLIALRLPPQIPAAAFESHIQCVLLQSVFLKEINSLIEDQPRFGELRGRLSRSWLLQGSARDPTDALQCIMRWLTYYLPDQYEIKVYNYSEFLRRREV